MRKVIAVAGLLALSSCANVPPTVASKVDAAVVGLTAAEKAALIYTTLPRCTAAVPPCSSQVTVDKIKDLDNRAYAAVKSAEQNEALLWLATQAIANLSAAIPVTPVPPTIVPR